MSLLRPALRVSLRNPYFPALPGRHHVAALSENPRSVRMTHMKRRPSRRLEPPAASATGHGAGRLWGTAGLKLGAAYRDAAKSLIEMVVGEYVRLHDAA